MLSRIEWAGHAYRFASIRLAHGNLGQHRKLTSGVCELKIDIEPGYRVYYTERKGELIILLAGGDKSTQQVDIKTVISLVRHL